MESRDPDRPPSRKRPRKVISTQVKVADVARLAGASPATVSRALNAPNLVSKDMLEKVLRAANALNWVPNGAAKALASMRTRTIGILIPTLNHHNFATLIESLQRGLGKAQYTLILGCIEYVPELRIQQVRKMIEQGIECLVLVGEAQPPALLDLLRVQGVPYLITYTNGREPSNICIGFDNYAASVRITDYLLSLGHRDFAMLAHTESDNDRIQQRIAGAKDALARAGLGIRPQLLVRVNGRHIASAREGMRAILKEEEFRPTALICTNDYIATGALIEAQANHVDVPSDLSIVGFDDIDTSAHLKPMLTTIRVPAREMGELVARYVIDLVSNGVRGDSIELPADLVIRESAAPPRKA